MNSTEKIIQLAREFSYQHNDATASLLNNHLVAFYHKAQAEAFGAAAEFLDGNAALCVAGSAAEVILISHAAAIREMAKEKQNATD